MELKRVKNTDLQEGNIVHFYGARFEIVSRKEHHDEERLIVCAIGRWLDGNVIPGYFGPNCKNWNFQGNEFASRLIEQ